MRSEMPLVPATGVGAMFVMNPEIQTNRLGEHRAARQTRLRLGSCVGAAL
ncbi:MAG: hypothetical protein ACJ79T_21765 [Myxococcales bacterium]